MIDNLTGNGLIIHHWDTDGLCSAAILMKYLNLNLDNWSPSIGVYHLSEEEIKKTGQYDFIIIVDIAFPPSNIQKIAEKTNVVIFDHHHQEKINSIKHLNPVSWGESPDNYPSCTWVIKKLLDIPNTLNVLLGIIGDKEHKIKKNSNFKPIINNFLREKQITFEDLLQLVRLIDSNYKVGDKKAVDEAPLFLKNEKIENILSNTAWRENNQKFNIKFNEIMKEPFIEEDGIIIKRVNTKFNLISTVTRQIAWFTGKNSIVVNTGFFKNHDQIYSRSQNIDMQPMLSKAKDLGYNAGGKKDVLGAIIPKNQTEIFIEKLKFFFHNQ
jgi:single-stranded DNA-specific DHH superfamily exonuclease